MIKCGIVGRPFAQRSHVLEAKMHVDCNVLPKPMSSHKAPWSLNLRKNASQFTPSLWYGRNWYLHLNGNSKFAIFVLSSNASKNAPSSKLLFFCSFERFSGATEPRASGKRGTNAANALVAAVLTSTFESDIRDMSGTRSNTQYGAMTESGTDSVTDKATNAAPNRAVGEACCSKSPPSNAGANKAKISGKVSSGCAVVMAASAFEAVVLTL